MTLKDFNKLLKRITYKESWRFLAYLELQQDRVMLTIKFETKNSEVNGQKATIGRAYSVHMEYFESLNEKDILDFIRNSIIDTETHEAMEWFKLDGKRVYDPHREDKK